MASTQDVPRHGRAGSQKQAKRRNAKVRPRKAMGYQLSEIRGKHHRLFVTPEHARSDAYREFWRKLNAGEYQAGEFQRVGKNGKEVWIQAS